jgi:hypothetical protein
MRAGGCSMCIRRITAEPNYSPRSMRSCARITTIAPAETPLLPDGRASNLATVKPGDLILMHAGLYNITASITPAIARSMRPRRSRERQQLVVLKRRTKRAHLRSSGRLFWVMLRRVRRSGRISFDRKARYGSSWALGRFASVLALSIPQQSGRQTGRRTRCELPSTPWRTRTPAWGALRIHASY